MQTYASPGSVDITPEAPVPLAGFAERTAPFRRVAGRLEANALLLKQDDRTIVLVTTDLVFVGRELRACVIDRLKGALTDTDLFLSASHTHFAPATDDRRPRLGRLSADYRRVTCDRIAELIEGLMRGPFTPVRLLYSSTTADHAVNRRLRVRWQVSRDRILLNATAAAPNFSGPHDETVHALRVVTEDERPIAFLWSYACHPVAFPQRLDVSPEYPGHVRERIRAQQGQRVPVLFFQGFAGDVRPRQPSDTSKPHGLRGWLLGPRFRRFESQEWIRWADSLADRVQAALRQTGRPVHGAIWSGRSARPTSGFVNGAGRDAEVTFHLVRLGDDVNIVGVSAEVVTEYASRLGGLLGEGVHIPVGYIDEVYGYLPTERMLDEGGYEVEGFLEPFALPGPVRPGVEREWASALQELATYPAMPEA